MTKLDGRHFLAKSRTTTQPSQPRRSGRRVFHSPFPCSQSSRSRLESQRVCPVDAKSKHRRTNRHANHHTEEPEQQKKQTHPGGGKTHSRPAGKDLTSDRFDSSLEFDFDFGFGGLGLSLGFLFLVFWAGFRDMRRPPRGGLLDGGAEGWVGGGGGFEAPGTG